MKTKSILLIFVFLFLVGAFSVSATIISYNNPVPVTSTSSAIGDGMRFYRSNDFTLLKINLTTGTVISRLIIYNISNPLTPTRQVLANISVNASQTQFDFNLALKGNQMYDIEGVSTSGTYFYFNPVTIPHTDNGTIWNCSINSGSGTCASGGAVNRLVQWIEVDNSTPVNYFNFTIPSESGTTKYLPQNYLLINVTTNITNFVDMTLNVYNQTTLIYSNLTTLNKSFWNVTLPFTNDTYYYNITARNTTNSSIYSSTYTNYILWSRLNLTAYNSITRNIINNFSVQLSNVNRSIVDLYSTSTGIKTDMPYYPNYTYEIILTLNEGNYDPQYYTYTFSNTSTLLNLSIFPANAGTVHLIYEANNSIFNCSGSGIFNLTSCKIYLGDTNSSVFDFKANGSSNYSFDLNAQTKFRLELVYPSGDIITRYYDIDIVPNQTNIRLCTNGINMTHYEMIIYSASQRGVNLINPYSDCIVGADYTRFAYQDAFILRTLTIDMPYYLYIMNDGVQTFLVGIDGSVESFINIDTLEFRSQAFDITIVSDSMTVYNNASTNTSVIRYINNANDNTLGNLTIYDSVTGTLYLSTGLIFNPNNFTVLFDYSAINYSNQSLFKATFCYVKDDGSSDCDDIYFDLESGVRGQGINSSLAFMIAVVLIVFGFTMTQSKLSFSWFGILMLIIALTILAFSPITWYTKALMGLIVVYIVFIAFIMPSKARDTIIG